MPIEPEFQPHRRRDSATPRTLTGREGRQILFVFISGYFCVLIFPHHFNINWFISNSKNYLGFLQGEYKFTVSSSGLVPTVSSRDSPVTQVSAWQTVSELPVTRCLSYLRYRILGSKTLEDMMYYRTFV